MSNRPNLMECQKLWECAVSTARTVAAKKRVCIAIYDEMGMPVFCTLEDGCHPRALDAAMHKAFTCARLGKTTKEIAHLIDIRGYTLATWAVKGVTDRIGGSPLRDASGALVGAVGFGGMMPDEDETVLDAILACFGELRGASNAQ